MLFDCCVGMLICVTCVCCFGLMITGFACFGFAFVWGCLLVVAVFQCCVCGDLWLAWKLCLPLC